jgi:pyruvate formate lyase activating enzyme
VDYEFRTTVCPTILSIEDLEAMARSVAGARRYILQQFVPETSFRRELRSVHPYAAFDLIAAAGKLHGIVKNCFVRGQGAAQPSPANAGTG